VRAELDTELEIGEQYIDRCLRAVVDGELTAVQASKAKWWSTELNKRVVDACVQLHGGYGYMNEYKVARDYVDVRNPDHLRWHDRDHEGAHRQGSRSVSPKRFRRASGR